MRRVTFRDPATAGSLVFAGIAIVGFVAIGLGWVVAARTLVVAYQVPALVSGGIGGLAIVLTGVGLLATHASRRFAARERDETDALIASIAALVETVRESR